MPILSAATYYLICVTLCVFLCVCFCVCVYIYICVSVSIQWNWNTQLLGWRPATHAPLEGEGSRHHIGRKEDEVD